MDTSKPSRGARLGDQIRAELALVLQRSARDPALRLITITHVRLTRDLQNARVFYTSLNDADQRQTARGLQRAAPYLRGQLAQRIRVRHVPTLTFEYDESLEREQRVAEVLESLRDETAAPEDEPTPDTTPDTDDV